jgi:hypothetical protein
VFELKHLLTPSELRGWIKYLALEPYNSVEIQLALVSTVANNAMGGKAKLEDMLITQRNIDDKDEDVTSTRPTTNQVAFAFGAFK